MCSSEQGGCYTSQGKMHHSLTHARGSRHHLIVRNTSTVDNILFIIGAFGSHNLVLEQVSQLRTPELERPRLFVVRALSITAKCNMPKLHGAVGHDALAQDKAPSSCCTHLQDQAPVLLRLTEVGAHLKDTHHAFLTQAHPGVVFFTLWQSVPECLEDLPDCFLAH